MTTTSLATAADRAPAQSFDHRALLYRAPEQLTERAAAFVTEALDAGQPVLVALPAPAAEPLRDRLGPAADRAGWVDMTVLGRNPGRILSALHGFAERHPGRAPHIVEEAVRPGHDSARVREAIRHEALLNLAFEGRTASLLCAYDASALPSRVLDRVRRTHPLLAAGDGRPGAQDRSPHYTDPLRICADCDTELPPPPGTAELLPYTSGDLSAVRARADRWAEESGLGPRRRTDFVLAVCEATTNSVRHGGGAGTLRLWAGDGAVRAEVRDGGLLGDPLAGRKRPDPLSPSGGRGLWMIHELCDFVELRNTPDGLQLRMAMSLDGPPA
ncbi:sensor histidine kinase [Streptomyces sp. LP05-1]|uniref:Sensor histidine kinase n=1 Tax=Streptomyces pyxinae TaxID=2970734 RepID=A0ABT2CDK5_9ACTN|nr:sensor histidine kinase [Streptomyces sp. LP05-1]MCS0634831.1 sensor histidine kinase [Streptomyces sp. LP05-1]